MFNNRIWSVDAALLGGALVMAVSPAAAQVETAPAQGGWSVTVAPYLWLSGLTGDTGLFGREPVHVDANFTDLLDTLRLPAWW